MQAIVLKAIIASCRLEVIVTLSGLVSLVHCLVRQPSRTLTMNSVGRPVWTHVKQNPHCIQSQKTSAPASTLMSSLWK